jgi:hypothetical protein
VNEQIIRKLVGDDPVDLLRHGPIEAAKTGFDVRDRNSQLDRDKRHSERRVDVAGNDDEVRPLLGEHVLHALHRSRGLLRVTARADSELVIGLRQPEFVHQDTRHHPVVVLAGVHQHVVAIRNSFPKLGVHRCGLHDVWPGPDHVNNPHLVNRP